MENEAERSAVFLLPGASSVSSDLDPSRFLPCMGPCSSPGEREIAEPMRGRKDLGMLRFQVGMPC